MEDHWTGADSDMRNDKIGLNQFRFTPLSRPGLHTQLSSLHILLAPVTHVDGNQQRQRGTRVTRKIQ